MRGERRDPASLPGASEGSAKLWRPALWNSGVGIHLCVLPSAGVSVSMGNRVKPLCSLLTGRVKDPCWPARGPGVVISQKTRSGVGGRRRLSPALPPAPYPRPRREASRGNGGVVGGWSWQVWRAGGSRALQGAPPRRQPLARGPRGRATRRPGCAAPRHWPDPRVSPQSAAGIGGGAAALRRGQHGGRRGLAGERGGGGWGRRDGAAARLSPASLSARSRRGRAKTTGGSGSTVAGCGTPFTTTTRTGRCRPATGGGTTTRPAALGRGAAPPPRRYRPRPPPSPSRFGSERQPVAAVAVPPGPLRAARPELRRPLLVGERPRSRLRASCVGGHTTGRAWEIRRLLGVALTASGSILIAFCCKSSWFQLF